MTTNDIKKQLTRKKKKRRILPTDYLSTGSAQLDLACTGQVGKGFLKGHMYLFVGDSESGKTFLCLTCFAEASINPNFDYHRLIYDNAEDGALMDIRHFFGQRVADRIEPPAKDKKGNSLFSKTIEDFYDHIDDAANDGRPFLYVIDSTDSLSSDAEIDKFQEQKTARRKGRKTTGSYGDGKAKKNSAGIRQILPKLRASGSILIVISQTRDNIGFGFETKTRSGGRALRFYATLEIWSAVGKKIKKEVRGKPRTIGTNILLEVKKNRVNGRHRKVEVPIFYAIGIDDIGGCVEWLMSEDHWRGSGKKINAPEFDYVGSKTGLIHKIEKEGLEKDLRMIVQEVWDDIEAACDPKRKKRYE